MKKLITLVASLLAVALLTVPVFAAENQSLAVDITKISISNEANNDLLNAATESSPVNGTRITTWDNTGHATQRWDYSESVPGKPQHYWLKNSANRSYAVTCYGTDGQQVTLAPYFSLSSFSVRSVVAAGLFCRKMDGRFCRKKPDTDVRRAGRIDVAGVFCRTREGRGQSRSLH